MNVVVNYKKEANKLSNSMQENQSPGLTIAENSPSDLATRESGPRMPLDIHPSEPLRSLKYKAFAAISKVEVLEVGIFVAPRRRMTASTN